MPVVVAPVLITAFGFLLCLFLWAASQSGQTFVRSFVEAMASKTSWIPGVGWLVRTGADALIHKVIQPISVFALRMEAPVVAFFLHVAAIVEGFAWSGYYTAVRTYDALYALRHAVIPALLKPILATVHALPRVVRVTVREGHQTRVIVQRVARAAVAGTIPQALPWVGKEVGRAEAAAGKALRALKDVRNLLAGALGVALVARAIGRLGLPGQRCANVNRWNRRLCGMNSDLLEGLLLDTLLILGTISLVEYAKFLESITEEGAGIIHGFIREA